MSKALDRSQRAGSDPIQIGSTKLVTDGNNDLTIQDTSNNRKKILASEVHLGDSSNVVILKKGSDNKIEFQTQASGGSATSSNAGGTVVYATISAMTAVSASACDQALVTANSGLYVHNGGGWYKVATINTSPTISSPSTGGSFTLALDGTATTIELVGADVDEGTTLQNSYAVTTGSLTNGGGATATITTSSTSNGTYTALNPSTNTTNRFFKVTPTTNSSYAGSFTLTFSVSDGINAATTVQSFSLEFASYGSAYFDGSGDHLLVPNTGTSNDLVLGTNDFTIEFWMKFPSNIQGVIVDFRSGHALSPMLNFSSGGNLRLYANDGYRITCDAITIGEWHHYALVRSSGSTKIYLDGVADNETYSDSNNYTGNKVYIGKHNANTDNDMDGYISNLRIVIGTAVYTSDFTRPTAPLDVINNTKLLTANKNNEIVDSSSIAHNIAKNGNVTHHVSNPFPWNTTGYGSLYFDGTGDYLSIAHASSFYDLGTADWTIECWVYFTDTSVFNGVFQLGKNVGALAAMLYTDGKLKLLEQDSAVVFESNTTFAANTWYHIAFTNNDYNNTQKLYVNGVQESNTGSKSTAFQFTEKTVFIGGRWFSNAFQRPMNGYISNFRIVGGSEVYTSNFTPSTTPLTAITNTKLLTAQRSVPASVANGSTYFDGSGDYIDTTNPLSGTGDFTMEGWVYPTTSGSYDGYFSTCLDTGANGGIVVAKDKFFVTHGGGSSQIGFSDTIENNAWCHIVLQRISNVFSLYKDGVLQGTATATASLTGSTIRLGSRYNNNTTHLLTGYISNFRIVAGSTVYASSGFTPPNSALTAITNTQLLTCQNSTGSITDASSNGYTITANGNTTASTFAPTKIAIDQSTSNFRLIPNGNTRNATSWPFNYNG